MSTRERFVGIDVHKDSLHVVVAGREGEVCDLGRISSDLHALERVLARLRADGEQLHVAYEAGPTGFVIARHMATMGVGCIVGGPHSCPEPIQSIP